MILYVDEGIHFLGCASATKWGANNPFDQPDVLPQICEKIVLPNIRLRASDTELFVDNPYVLSNYSRTKNDEGVVEVYCCQRNFLFTTVSPVRFTVAGWEHAVHVPLKSKVKYQDLRKWKSGG